MPPIPPKQKGKKMIDVKALSAQELEAQRKISEEIIKKSEEGIRLAAIEEELKTRKESARKLVLASWKKYDMKKGIVYMPYRHPITAQQEFGEEIPWSLSMTNPAAAPYPTIRYTLAQSKK